jgi:hypothetical protein
MSYDDLSGMVRGSVGGPAPGVPAPLPGLHQFEIARIGSDVHFSLNQQHFASLATVNDPVDSITLRVGFLHPGQNYQPAYFGTILIVPAPTTAMVALAIAGFLFPHRRR